MTDTHSLVGLKPLQNKVLVYIYDDGNNSIDIGEGKRLITSLADTLFDSVHEVIDGKHPGIRSRWAMVIGIANNTPNDIKLGAKVLLAEMKWRRGIYATNSGHRIWDIPFHDILVVDEEGFNNEEIAKIDEYMKGFGVEQYSDMAYFNKKLMRGLRIPAEKTE